MCLGVPMEVIAIDGTMALCRAKGVERDVNLFLIQDQPIAPGDFVLVHVGYAIQTVAPEQAQSTWDLLDQILEHDRLTPTAGTRESCSEHNES